MERVGPSGESLITWHREFHKHPIADPSYARENLVSLGATAVMLYFYFIIATLSLHYLVLLGYFQTQSITWAVVEYFAGFVLYRIPASFASQKLDIFLAILVTIVAARATKHSFEIIKATLHPSFVTTPVPTAARKKIVRRKVSDGFNLSSTW